jgi:SIR2-like domain
MAALAEPNAHYGRVVRDLTDNRVVPLLGAGVNLCDFVDDRPWQPDERLPSGTELASHLAQIFYYPDERKIDLLRVSQYAVAVNGTGPLYAELRRVFRRDVVPTSVHRFFADLPGLVATRRGDELTEEPYQLIVTTNYDDALERAFADANVDVDVIWYIADGAEHGKFWHRAPDGETRTIEVPEEYDAISLEERPVILKIHGAVDHQDKSRDSYVITEDHYIDYLTKTDLKKLVPDTVATKLESSRFLFLGYSMQDWNLRVILHRIWGRQPLTYRSWAIQRDPSEIERQLWQSRDVDVLDIPLDEYIDELRRRFDDDG